MSLVFGDRTLAAHGAVSRPIPFWQIVGRALDAYSLRRTRHLFAGNMLRRCNRDVARYRRLLHKHDSVLLPARRLASPNVKPIR